MVMEIVAKDGFILHMLHEQVLFPLELDGHGFEEREHFNVTEAGIAALLCIGIPTAIKHVD